MLSGQAGKRFKTFCHFLMLFFLNYVVVISNVRYASGVVIVIIVIVNFIDDVVCCYWEVCVSSMINATKCPLYNPILDLIVKFQKPCNSRLQFLVNGQFALPPRRVRLIIKLKISCLSKNETTQPGLEP